jgi:hypothetical protein
VFCFSNQQIAGGSYRSRRDRSDLMPKGMLFDGKRTLHANHCFLSSRAASAKGRNAKQANRDVGEAQSPETKKAPLSIGRREDRSPRRSKGGPKIGSTRGTIDAGTSKRGRGLIRPPGRPVKGAPASGKVSVGVAIGTFDPENVTKA